MTEINRLETAAFDYLFQERDRAVIAALSGEKIRPEQYHALTEGMDPDTESALYMLSLGIIGYKQGWENFPQDTAPRLQGLHRYYQVRNSAAVPWLKERLEILKKAEIPVMLTGGAALRAVYFPETPRMMDGYDLTVPSKEYEKALNLLRESVKGTADSGRTEDRTIQGITLIRLHEGVPDKRFFKEEPLWDGSDETTYLGHEVRVLSAQQMALSLLSVPFGPWAVKEGNADRSRRLSDACRILNRLDDLSGLAEEAKKVRLGEISRFYLAALNAFLPVFTKKECGPLFAQEEEYLAFLKEFTAYCRLYLKIGDREKEKNSLRMTDRVRLYAAEYKLYKTMKKTE